MYDESRMTDGKRQGYPNNPIKSTAQGSQLFVDTDGSIVWMIKPTLTGDTDTCAPCFSEILSSESRVSHFHSPPFSAHLIHKAHDVHKCHGPRIRFLYVTG